jgi:valyl-tRNA synthetase
VNKLYNAAKLLHFLNVLPSPTLRPPASILHPTATPQHPVNIWIMAEVALASESVHLKLSNGRLDEAAAAAQKFVWDVYCSQYLEMLKTMVPSSSASASASASTTTISHALSSETVTTCLYAFSAVRAASDPFSFPLHNTPFVICNCNSF